MGTGADAPGLFDPQGCLTAAAFARIEAAPPGRAPAELATHLAACARCQRRLLNAASGSSAGAARRRQRPPVWRTAVVAAGGVLLVLMALVMARLLSSP
jgi:hypothetical protein